MNLISIDDFAKVELKIGTLSILIPDKDVKEGAKIK